MPPRNWSQTSTPWPMPCQAQASIQRQLSWLNTSTKHLKTRCSYHIVGRGVEHPWWTINWVAWQRDYPKLTLSQRHRRVLVHLEEFESLRVEKGRCQAMVQIGSYIKQMWLWGETDYVSYYDMWWCPELNVYRPGYPNPCRCQLHGAKRWAESI